MFILIFLANNFSMQEEIKAFPKRNEKLSTKTKWFIFVIVVLSVLLLIESAFLLTEYLKQRVSIPGNIPLGTEVTVNLNSEGAFATAITYDGSNIPGASVKQVIKMSLPLESETAVVRAKVFTCDEGGNISEVPVTVASEVWLKQGEYYYYNDILSAGVTTNFSQSITLPTSEDFFNAEKYYEIIVVFETLLYNSGTYDVGEIWTNLPENWLTNV